MTFLVVSNLCCSVQEYERKQDHDCTQCECFDHNFLISSIWWFIRIKIPRHAIAHIRIITTPNQNKGIYSPTPPTSKLTKPLAVTTIMAMITKNNFVRKAICSLTAPDSDIN